MQSQNGLYKCALQKEVIFPKVEVTNHMYKCMKWYHYSNWQ